MSNRIEDYAFIGDCHTGALIARNGSVDWLCFPRFDSGACFAALLGNRKHGRWLITPAEPCKVVRRRYREGTLVLETEFETAGGVVTLVDFMPSDSQGTNMVRLVVGRRGQVRMRTEAVIRLDYGAIVPWVEKLPGAAGIRATAGPDTLYLRTTVPLRGEDLSTVGEFQVAAGEQVAFELAYRATHEPAPAACDPQRSLKDTEAWWREWSSRCTYQGEWREAVLRSLITLKALTYAPTGGIVAAATTSLPEQIGGPRNWDYRYCWLRDSTFTLYALMVGGYIDEAKAWRQWLVNAVAGTPAELQIMYGLDGRRRLNEQELPWLPGYENSAPVRTGNAAFQQRQIDVYGEVMDTLFAARRLGIPHDDRAWSIQRGILRFLESNWREPDEGIWEVRGGRRQFTHSKVMAWVAFDRAVKAVEQFGRPGDADRWRQARDAVHRQVMAEGFNPAVNAFTQFYGSKEPDAALLMLPLVGFIRGDDPKMVGTVELIRRQLSHDGFVRRYVTEHHVDGVGGSESGVFLICTFWLADNLALQGRKAEARELFERLLDLRNDVGLISEEYDPAARRFLGNLPQAFSHVGLINTARNLSSAGGPAEARRNH